MRTILLLSLAGCTGATGPIPLWDPGSDALFDAPWPTDARRRADGTTEVTGWPGDEGASLLTRYLPLANAQAGYGTNSPIYLRFSGPLDVEALPSPAGSLADGSPLLLVNVDPASPRWGERIPVRWEFTEDPTRWRPSNLLAVAPVWGFPLRPSTTYALVVTTDIARQNTDFARVWEGDPIYADLEAALPYHRLSPEDIAIATVFTTLDPLDEMRRMARFVHEDLAPPEMDQTIAHRPELDTLYYRFYEGRYQTPLFQHGARPYALSGGELRFREDGQPIVAGWDEMRMAICTPLDLSAPPEGGWPVVLYAHGTGGDYRSYCNSRSGISEAALFARAGMIGIGVDQPLHGTRATPSTDPDQHWFNYLNPDAGRTNFRQAAMDTVYLAHALTERRISFRTSDGEQLPLDASRIYFMGHSQGGISGAIALPFIGEDVPAAVLSGAGGGLAITIVERKDPLDIAAQLGLVLGFDEGEVATELHPVVGLVQWLVEVTDPVNYAPYYFAEDAGLPGGAPMHVLLTSGQHDAQTPHHTATALAAAARLPLLDPAFDAPDGMVLRGLGGARSPLSGNATAWDGSAVTAGVSQWEDGDHWVVFDDKRAALMYQDFLATAARGTPTIAPER